MSLVKCEKNFYARPGLWLYCFVCFVPEVILLLMPLKWPVASMLVSLLTLSLNPPNLFLGESGLLLPNLPLLKAIPVLSPFGVVPSFAWRESQILGRALGHFCITIVHVSPPVI